MKNYTIVYWAGDGKRKEFQIKAKFLQDAKEAFYQEVEREDPQAEIVAITAE